MYPNGHSFIFTAKYKILKTVLKWPSVRWLRNTKFLKFYPNVHSFFVHKRQNLKLSSNGHSFFGYKQRTQQTFVGLQHVLSVTVFRQRRRKIVTLKMFSRRLEDFLETCLEDVLKICREDVLNTCFEGVFKTSWRQTKRLLGISVSSKSKSVPNKSIFHSSISDESKANPKYFN